MLLRIGLALTMVWTLVATPISEPCCAETTGVCCCRATPPEKSVSRSSIDRTAEMPNHCCSGVQDPVPAPGKDDNPGDGSQDVPEPASDPCRCHHCGITCCGKVLVPLTSSSFQLLPVPTAKVVGETASLPSLLELSGIFRPPRVA